MAAVETIPSAVSVTTSVKTFYRVVYVTGKDEKTGEPSYAVKIVNEKAGEDVQKSATTEQPLGIFEGKEVASIEVQSFVQPTAKTDAGWAQLIPDEGERAAMTARGASTKLDNKARQWLSAQDDDGNFVNPVTEGAYDQTEQLKEITNRRLSPDEKLQEELTSMQFTPEMLQRFEAILNARKQEFAAK